MKRKKHFYVTAALVASAIVPAIIVNVDEVQATSEVTFNDSNLHAAIATILGKAPTDPITISEMESLTSLDLSRKNISDLTGIEYATNLTKLSVSYNPISNISPVSNLTKLKDFSLWSSSVSDISPLQHITSLEFLTLADSEITDISPLQSLPNLTALVVIYNKIDFSTEPNLSAYSYFSSKIPGLFWPSYQKLGTITTKYIDENNTEIESEIKNNVSLDEAHTITAKSVNGYSLVGSNTQSVNLSNSNLSETVIFNIQQILGTVTVNYVDENGVPIEAAKVVPNVVVGAHTETASPITGYTLVGTSTQTVTIDAANLTHTITFTYAEDTAPVPTPPAAILGTVTVNYVDENGVPIETAKVVPNVATGAHTETAPTITGYTLVGASTQTVTVDSANLTHTIAFTYKKDVAAPTPPVVTPVPTPTPPVVEPSPVQPTPPSVIKPDPTTPAVTENHGEGNYQWIVDLEKAKEEGLIKDNEFVFEAEGIKITVPLNDFKEAKGLEVSWIHLGKEHYQLTIKVDGKDVQQFSKAVKVEKTHGFAYLIRGEDGDYAAIPYTYKNSKFNFETKNIQKPFYFSTIKHTFRDINGLYSQAAIEQLASRYIVFGTSENIYSPHQNITRSQFSAMLVRGLGLEPINGADTYFADITNHWAVQDIQALYELGIVKGVEGQFKPNGELKRRQAILMIYRLLKEYGVELPTNNAIFEDAHLLQEDAELQRAAGALQTLGIFEGYNGYLNPNENLTRIQMAKVLELLLQQVGKY